jgi:hypothetical protein
LTGSGPESPLLALYPRTKSALLPVSESSQGVASGARSQGRGLRPVVRSIGCKQRATGVGKLCGLARSRAAFLSTARRRRSLHPRVRSGGSATATLVQTPLCLGSGSRKGLGQGSRGGGDGRADSRLVNSPIANAEDAEAPSAMWGRVMARHPLRLWRGSHFGWPPGPDTRRSSRPRSPAVPLSEPT